MPSAWRIEDERHAQKQLRKLDRAIAARIVRDLQEGLDRTGDPRGFGEPIVGNWQGFWRYRVGDYRAIAKIEEERVTVFVIHVAHRREVYR